MVFQPTTLLAYTISDIFIDQGCTFTANINVLTPGTNNSINVAGWSFEGQMREYYTSANVANLNVNILNANLGSLSLYLSANASVNIASGEYEYDVISIDTANNVERILEGLATVNPQVTVNPWQNTTPIG